MCRPLAISSGAVDLTQVVQRPDRITTSIDIALVTCQKRMATNADAPVLAFSRPESVPNLTGGFSG